MPASTGMRTMAEISDDDLGLLCLSAASFGSRLAPKGHIPDRIWAQLTPEWQERIQRTYDE